MNDNFKCIYKILKTLEKAMDYTEYDFSCISHEALGVSKEYIQGKSYLLISEEEAQKLILSKALTGVVHISNGGKQVKEVADFGKIIGVDISRKTGAETKTTKGTIHYSKTGTHLVPTRSDN